MTAITKIVKFFSNNKFSSSKNNNGNVVGTDKTIDSNITFRIKKSKKYNKIDNNNNNYNNNSNSNNNEYNNNNKSSNNDKVIAPHRHHPEKKLFSYLETAW